MVKAIHLVKGEGYIWPWKFKVKIMAKVKAIDHIWSLDIFAFHSVAIRPLLVEIQQTAQSMEKEAATRQIQQGHNKMQLNLIDPIVRTRESNKHPHVALAHSPTHCFLGEGQHVRSRCWRSDGQNTPPTCGPPDNINKIKGITLPPIMHTYGITELGEH